MLAVFGVPLGLDGETGLRLIFLALIIAVAAVLLSLLTRKPPKSG
jgi:hypothetical protein